VDNLAFSPHLYDFIGWRIWKGKIGKGLDRNYSIRGEEVWTSKYLNGGEDLKGQLCDFPMMLDYAR
jgi:hypothetical protein